MAGTLQGRRLAWVVLALPAASEHTESLHPEAMAGKEATTAAFHLLVALLPESLGLPGCRCQSRQKNPLLMTHQSQFRQQTFPLN